MLTESTLSMQKYQSTCGQFLLELAFNDEGKLLLRWHDNDATRDGANWATASNIQLLLLRSALFSALHENEDQSMRPLKRPVCYHDQGMTTYCETPLGLGDSLNHPGCMALFSADRHSGRVALTRRQLVKLEIFLLQGADSLAEEAPAAFGL